MATHGELTVGKLKQFLSAFPDHTKVVIGNSMSTDSKYETLSRKCHANTFYPPGTEDVWVIIDPGDNM